MTADLPNADTDCSRRLRTGGIPIKPGDVFVQFGVELVVVQVTEYVVVYCCRFERSLIAPRCEPLQQFLDGMAKGVLLRAEAV